MGGQVTEEDVRFCKDIVNEFDKVVSIVSNLSSTTMQPELNRLSELIDAFLKYIDVSFAAILVVLAFVQALTVATERPGQAMTVIVTFFAVLAFVVFALRSRGRKFEEHSRALLESLRGAVRPLDDTRRSYAELFEFYMSRMSSCYEKLCKKEPSADIVLCVKLSILASPKIRR